MSEHRSRPSRSFVPTEATTCFAIARGLDLADEREAWLDWCNATGRTYLDHQAGFRTWMRHAVQYGRGHAPAAATTTLRSILGPYICPLGLGCDNGWVPDSSPAQPCQCRSNSGTSVRRIVESQTNSIGQKEGAPAETEAPNPTLFQVENGSQGNTAGRR